MAPGKRATGTRRWSARVKMVSTAPPKALFTKDAWTIMAPSGESQEGEET
jgi:hypothetical protein